MEIKSLGVLHLDNVRTWRGGQQQSFYLLEQMIKAGWHTAMACQPGSENEKRLTDHHLPVHPVRMYGEYDIPAGRKIARLCKEKNYHIIHAHSAHALAIGLWAKLFYGDLILVGSRRVDFSIRKNKLSIYKYTNPLLDKIICISNNIREVLIRDGVPREKLITIHSGIDTHKFDQVKTDPDFRRDWGIPENHILIGTVAAIVGHKDYPNLLKAARIVLDKNKQVSFMALGEGEDQDDVFALAKDLDVRQRFIFAGFQPDVGRFLKAFDIFVLASHLEGLGTSILDAQSVGLPVVATRAGGIPEAVFHEGNGLLVLPRDPHALAGALLELTGNGKKRAHLGERGKKTVRQFDIANTVRQTLELYETLFKKKYSRA